MPKEKTKSKEKSESRFEVTEVATQTRPVIKDNKNDNIYTEVQMLCYLANEFEEVKKSILG